MSNGSVQLPPIVTVGELHAIVAGPADVVVADTRWYLDRRPGRAAYQQGHIPGAIFVDLDEHLAFLPTKKLGRHPLPAPATFGASLGALGIGPENPVIAYDDSGGMSAGRLVWMLRVLGHPAALLDGGLQAWDGPLETTTNVRTSVFSPIRPWPDHVLADADAAAEAGEATAELLIDSRAPERYRGETEPVDPRPGHIPGALNRPFTDNLDPDGRFKSATELAADWAELGVTADTASATTLYCGSGVSACHNLLAMERAGLAGARLYAGSWSQWSNDPDRPAELG